MHAQTVALTKVAPNFPEPNYGVMQESDGNYYSTTPPEEAISVPSDDGSADTCNYIYKITPTGNVSVFHPFIPPTSVERSIPTPLVEGADGALVTSSIGVTASGWKMGTGTLDAGTVLAGATTSLPDTMVGKAYGQPFAVTVRGTPPYSLVLLSGELPHGLSLDPNRQIANARFDRCGRWKGALTCHQSIDGSSHNLITFLLRNALGYCDSPILKSAHLNERIIANALIETDCAVCRSHSD